MFHRGHAIGGESIALPFRGWNRVSVWIYGKGGVDPHLLHTKGHIPREHYYHVASPQLLWIKVLCPGRGSRLIAVTRPMLDVPWLRDTDPWRSILQKAAVGELGSLMGLVLMTNRNYNSVVQEGWKQKVTVIIIFQPPTLTQLASKNKLWLTYWWRSAVSLRWQLKQTNKKKQLSIPGWVPPFFL